MVVVVVPPLWSIDFRHTWMPSPPGRAQAARQGLWSEDFRRLCPGLSSCFPSSESCLPSFSSPRNLEEQVTQLICQLDLNSSVSSLC